MQNIDNVNTYISKKLNHPRDVIAKVNKVYWKEVKHRMTHLEDTTVFIRGLTSFTISRYLVTENIFQMIEKIRNTRRSTRLTERKKYVMLEVMYEYLRKLLKQRNEVAKVYYERTERISKANTEGVDERS